MCVKTLSDQRFLLQPFPKGISPLSGGMLQSVEEFVLQGCVMEWMVEDGEAAVVLLTSIRGRAAASPSSQ